MKKLFIVLFSIITLSYSCKKNNSNPVVNDTKSLKLTKISEQAIKDAASAYDLVEMSDGSLILLTDSGSFFTGTHLQLVKINNDGQIAWKKNFITPYSYYTNYAYSIQKDNDENLIMSSALSYAGGDNLAWIIKANKNGVRVWDKTLTATTHEGNYGQGNIVITNIGDIVALFNPAEGSQNNCILDFISANGQNSKKITIPGIVYAGELKLTSQNTLTIAGCNFNINKSATKMVIVTTDLSGNILSSKETTTLAGSQLLYGITELNQSLYVTGHFTSDTSVYRNFLLGKFSLNGDFVKMSNFGRNFNDVGLCIQALDNGNLVIGGYSQNVRSSDLTGEMYFSITDADGNIKANENLGGDGRILSIKKSSSANTFWVLNSNATTGYSILKYSYK